MIKININMQINFIINYKKCFFWKKINLGIKSWIPMNVKIWISTFIGINERSFISKNV